MVPTIATPSALTTTAGIGEEMDQGEGMDHFLQFSRSLVREQTGGGGGDRGGGDVNGVLGCSLSLAQLASDRVHQYSDGGGFRADV
jgi:hypothetical protein